MDTEIARKASQETTGLQVLFSPAEFEALERIDLSETVCVVFDVLRATSSMTIALSNGAKAIVPVTGIPQALDVRSRRGDVLLAGERHGLRISADLTGTIAFDLGNSPREFTPERVAGRTIAMTTTNGTRALRACAHAREILAACFLNLRAVSGYLVRDMPSSLVLVCSGTKEASAYEDVLCAGALAEALQDSGNWLDPSDSAIMAQRLYADERKDLFAAVSRSQNGRRLLSHPELREDVKFCVQRDLFNIVPVMTKSGEVVPAPKTPPELPRTIETTS